MKKIEHYGITHRPSVIDEEALTALELAGRTAAKVNEVIDNVDNFQTNVNNNVDNFKTAINNTVNGQNQRIQENTETMAEWVSDNNVKINNFMGTYDNKLIQVNQKIDSLEVSPYIDMAYWTNLFNPNGCELGKYASHLDGTVQDNASFFMSSFMRVTPNDTMSVYQDLITTNTVRFIAFYDEGKNFISGKENANNIKVPANAYYMRISNQFLVNSDLNHYMVISQNYRHNTFINYGEMLKKLDYETECYPYILAYGNRIGSMLSDYYASHIDGVLLLNTSYVVSEMIPILPNETIKFTDISMNLLQCRMFATYDINGNFISGGENVSTITQAGDIAYVKVTFTKDNAGKLAMVADVRQNSFINAGDFLNSVDIASQTVEKVKTLIADGKQTITKANMSETEILKTTDDFPKFLGKGFNISAFADFYGFTSLTIGWGLDSSDYDSLIITISPSTLNLVGKTMTEYNIPHSLTITDSIYITIQDESANGFLLTIVAGDGVFTKKVNFANNYAGNICLSGAQDMFNVSLSVTNNDIKKPIWVIGDSYLGMATDRVMGQLIKNFGCDNFLLSAKPGLDSNGAYDELIRLLNFGTPSKLIWYIGVNDSNVGNFYQTLQKLKTLCSEKGIELILNSPPYLPSLAYITSIISIVNSSGTRYINSFQAMTKSSDTTLGTIATDGIHPTEKGARALAMRMLVDVPEIMG